MKSRPIRLSWRVTGIVAPAFALASLGSSPAALPGQSTLERTPNLAGSWIAPRGVLQFDFVHRFDASPAPEKKVTSIPTFLVATGVSDRVMLGFAYNTNSTLVSRYPNEWEFFARGAPMLQAGGHPFDVAVELGYNLAAEGIVGELSVARDAGKVRLLGVGRVLSDPREDATDFAVGGGAVLRLSRWAALAGDVVTVVDRSPSEKVAWSAGLQLGLPSTPHTFSLQASNTVGIGLQSASRGTGQTLYGFEFTIPITMRRYVSGAAARPAPDDVVRGGTSSAPVVISIKNLVFGNGSVTVAAGTVVEWLNDDPLAHSVIAGDSTYDSGLLQPGASWRRVFAVPGTYSYTCQPHPFMKGTIIVVAKP